MITKRQTLRSLNVGEALTLPRAKASLVISQVYKTMLQTEKRFEISKLEDGSCRVQRVI